MSQNGQNSGQFAQNGPKAIRTSVYIDGFNLYFGIKQKGWRKYYWLDVSKFAELLAKGRQVIDVKYFTADIDGNPGKAARQQAFLNALRTSSSNLQIIKGKYQRKRIKCFNCLQDIPLNEEKMTDVNIASHLINDAYKDRFDLAIVVSGDSDLVPPIEVVKTEFPQKQVLVAFPPLRHSHHLKQTTSSFFISEKHLKLSQMPDIVIKPDGTQLYRPPSWK